MGGIMVANGNIDSPYINKTLKVETDKDGNRHIEGPRTGNMIRVPAPYTEQDVWKKEKEQVLKDLFWFKDKCAYLEKQNKDLRDEIDSIKRSQDVGTGS